MLGIANPKVILTLRSPLLLVEYADIQEFYGNRVFQQGLGIADFLDNIFFGEKSEGFRHFFACILQGYKLISDGSMRQCNLWKL